MIFDVAVFGVSLEADVLEVVWTIVAFVGLGLALGERAYSRRDREIALRLPPTRERDLELAIVASDLGFARWAVGIEAANLAIGLLAMATPPNPASRSLGTWVVVCLLIGGAAALPAALAEKRHRRRRLLDRRL